MFLVMKFIWQVLVSLVLINLITGALKIAKRTFIRLLNNRSK